MVKVNWNKFGFSMVNGNEEDPEEASSKTLSKCDWLTRIGDNILTGLGVIYDRVPFRHLLPILVLILYTIFGGWLFQTLEHTETRQSSYANNATLLTNANGLKNQLSLHRKEMARRLWRLKLNNTTPRVRERMVDELWAWYDAKKLDTCNKEGREDGSQWTMWNSMFYAATLYTTIGYGHVTPRTTGGRVATMLYAIVGIPLVLTILNDWGILLFRFLRHLHYQYIVFKNRKSAWVPLSDRPEEVGELPVSLAVFIFFFWLCTCAGIFLIWEDDWNYFTSFYFFFISLTTIGLGDVVPRYPQYTLMSFILVLCGLSMVSMSFNIIQAKVESLFKSLMMGIEQEYWQKQVEPEHSQFGEDSVQINATVGVMQLWKKKPLKQRILFRLMDKSKKQMLQDMWEKKANTRNQATQTIPKTYATGGFQVDLDQEEAETKYKNRKYIYNLGD